MNPSRTRGRLLPHLSAAAALVAAVSAGSAASRPFSLVAFHASSDFGADVEQVAEVAGLLEADLWAISGTRPEWAERLRAAASAGSGTELTAHLGSSGGEARLLVLHDPARLRLLEPPEDLHGLAVPDGRAPLVARLRELSTGTDLQLLVVDLPLRNTGQRRDQAHLINEWVLDQELPVVLAGNLDLDYRVHGSHRDQAYDILMDRGALRWVRPNPLDATYCLHDSRLTVMDFVWLGGAAVDWDASARVAFDASDYCRTYSPACCWEPPRCRGDCGPAHVPVLAQIQPEPPEPEAPAEPAGGFRFYEAGGDDSRPVASSLERAVEADVLERLRRLEDEVRSLRRRVEELEGR